MEYLQTFSEDRAETYELPKHIAVDVLSKEIVVQERRIDSRTIFTEYLWEKTNEPYQRIAVVVDEILADKQKIEECRQAIRWIYEKL